MLKEARLVTERREGRQRLDRLSPRPLREVKSWVAEFESVWNRRLDALAGYLDRKHGRER